MRRRRSARIRYKKMRRWNRPWNSVHRARSVSFSPHSRSKSAAEVSTVLCQWNLLRFSCISAGQRLKPAERLFAPAGVWIQLYVPLPLGRCSFRRIGALIKQGEIEHRRREHRILIQRMPEFFAGLFQAGSVTFHIGDSQVVMNRGTGPDFALRDLEVRNSAAEFLLKEVETAHLVTVGRKSCHFSRD